MYAPPSITVQDPAGRTVAFVEVKASARLDPDMAISLRRHMAGPWPKEAYFLVVSQDHGHLWVPEQAADPDAAPAYTFSMKEALETTWPRFRSKRLFVSQLVLLIYGWLRLLAERNGTSATEAESSLQRAGFLDIIHAGTLALG